MQRAVCESTVHQAVIPDKLPPPAGESVLTHQPRGPCRTAVTEGASDRFRGESKSDGRIVTRN